MEDKEKKVDKKEDVKKENVVDAKKEDVKETKKEDKKFDKVDKKSKKEKKTTKNENKTDKKSNTPMIIGIVVVVILILVILAYAFLASTPKRSVEGVLQGLKDGDYDKVNEYVNYEELISASSAEDGEELNAEAQKLLFDKLSWDITEESKDGDTANVTVEITNKNFKTIINNYMQRVLRLAFSGQDVTDEQNQNYLIEELNSEDVEMTTTTQVINLVKQDGKWIITTTNDELVNSLLPGLKEAIDSLS